MNLVPFTQEGTLPAYLKSATNVLDVNKDVIRGAVFPTMSIKGMKFTMVKDGIKTVLTKPDDPDEVAQNIGVVPLRINMHAKVFYAKKYANEDSEGQRPDCYSYDGIAPSANAATPQAKKCAVCPHNVWGSRITESGQKTKACNDRARIAISAPDKLEPMLLNVPPASLKNLRDAVKIINQRSTGDVKLQYNMVVIKVGFDREAPSPLLTFKPIALLDDGTYAQVKEMYDSELVRSIVGADDLPLPEVDAPETKPAVESDELDAALAARDAMKKAKAPAKAEPEPEPETKPKKAAKAADEPKKAAKAEPEAKPSGGSSLLSDLDALLGSTDD